LKDHPDPAPQGDHVKSRIVDVLPVQDDLPRHPAGRDEVIHPVQAAQEGALAATRRPDESRHLMEQKIKGDVLQRVKVTVIEIKMLCRHFHECTHRFVLSLYGKR